MCYFPLCLSPCKRGEGEGERSQSYVVVGRQRILTLPLSSRRKGGLWADAQSLAWTDEPTIEPHGFPRGRGNRNCFSARFVVKRQAYVAKRIGAFYGDP